MVMTLKQLIEAVRDEVHDPYGYRWSNETITRYLNDGQVDLLKDSRVLSLWEYNVAPNDVSVERSADLLVPKYAYFDLYNGERFPLYFTNDFPSSDDVGVPEKLCIVGTQYYFFPVPYTNGKLRLLGVRRPSVMVGDADTPEVEDADSLLVAYATWQCYLADSDPMAQVIGDYYNRRKAEWLVLDAMKNPTPNRIERNWWD